MKYKIISNNKTLLLLSKKEFKGFMKDKPNTEFLKECIEIRKSFNSSSE